MPLRILALEPYYGGSHQAFLDGYVANSRHAVEPVTMAPRKWKWRMRGAAITLSEEVRRRRRRFDVLLVSDYLDLAALVALAEGSLGGAPTVAYFHENQITYPLSDDSERDYQYGFTNITTCLAADRVLFNSRYHLESFLAGARLLLARMPDYVPEWAPERIRDRSQVVPVGVDLRPIDEQCQLVPPNTGPLTVLWNHRWEYDKGAETFFDVVSQLKREGHEFRLAVLGQSFRTAPPVFAEAASTFGDHLVACGYVESRTEYCRALLSSDVVVSTAINEFFGISVVEAVYAGCLPLLPNSLSYPELIPESLHDVCLYWDPQDLAQRLAHWAGHVRDARAVDLSAHMRRFGWDRVGPQLDAVMEEAYQERGHG